MGSVEDTEDVKVGADDTVEVDEGSLLVVDSIELLVDNDAVDVVLIRLAVVDVIVVVVELTPVACIVGEVTSSRSYYINMKEWCHTYSFSYKMGYFCQMIHSRALLSYIMKCGFLWQSLSLVYYSLLINNSTINTPSVNLMKTDGFVPIIG